MNTRSLAKSHSSIYVYIQINPKPLKKRDIYMNCNKRYNHIHLKILAQEFTYLE